VKNTRPATITPAQITNIPRMGARVLRLLPQPGGFEAVAQPVEAGELELNPGAAPTPRLGLEWYFQ
jgi:hypothetical protein